MLAIIEGLLRASQQPSGQKVAILETVSVDLNVLRVFLRLAKDTRAIDLKKYTQAQIQVDEIGRMLGGWLRSLRSGSKPPPPVEHPDEKRGRKCQRDATPAFGFALSFQLLTLRPCALLLTLTRLP